MDQHLQYVETIQLKAGDYLFRTGDMDDSIFVVAKGEIEACTSWTMWICYGR